MNTGDSYWRTSNTAWLLLVVKQLKGARRYLRILPTSVDEVIHKQINSPSTKILHRINRILVASESYTCCFRFGTSSQKTTLTLHGSRRFQKKGVPTISPGDCPVLGLLHHQERQGHINVTNHLEVDRHSQTALNPGFRKGLENKGSTVSFKFGLNALDLRCCVSDVVMIALLRRIRFHICM